MPVGVMLESMTSSELTEWAAWFDYKANPPKPVQSVADLKAAASRMSAQRKKGASRGSTR